MAKTYTTKNFVFDFTNMLYLYKNMQKEVID